MKKNILYFTLIFASCLISIKTLANTETKKDTLIKIVGSNTNNTLEAPIAPKNLTTNTTLSHPTQELLTKPKSVTWTKITDFKTSLLNKLNNLSTEKKIYSGIVGTAVLIYTCCSYRQGTIKFWNWESSSYTELKKKYETLKKEYETLNKENKKLENLGVTLNAQNIEKNQKKLKELQQALKKLQEKK